MIKHTFFKGVISLIRLIIFNSLRIIDYIYPFIHLMFFSFTVCFCDNIIENKIIFL